MMKKKLLFLTLALALCLGLLPTSTIAASSGSCGENVTWGFDQATGTLTISGTGAMEDFFFDGSNWMRPWNSESDNIKALKIEDGITKIGEGSFYGCNLITEVKIPQSVRFISPSSFSGCSSLVSFSVQEGNPAYSSPDGVLYDKSQTTLIAYPEAKSTTVTVPPNVQIGEMAFANNRSLTTVIMSSGTTSIGEYAFSSCRALNSVIFPSTLKSIGNRAFLYCTTLSTPSLPEGLTHIGEGAFENDDAIESLSLPEGLVSIGDHAFSTCRGLTSAKISSTVSQMGVNPFEGCEKLSAIQVAENNQFYCSVDGVLYDKAKTTLIACPMGKKGDLIVPVGVTRIEEGACENCCNLRTVTLPESVTSIGAHAFMYCYSMGISHYGLTTINIPKGVTEIEEYTFFGSSAITSITLPEGLTRIGSCAFLHLTKLDEVTIPDTVTFIDGNAFNPTTVLRGRSGGYAEAYAKQNGMKFLPIETPPITATPTRSTVLVNGQSVAFDAYTINGNNYFKLRDLAKVLSGTDKQFEVTWDGKNNAINLLSGKPYTAVGGELAQGDGTNKTAQVSTSTIYLNGQPVSLLAYTIGGNNYFKLRDVGQTFGFNVSWDGARNTIVIDTTQSYTPD